jgi:hypothetical protein
VDWFSIEVLDGSTSASIWADIFGDSLIADAVSMSALDWSWHRLTWGVVFEVAFRDEQAWEIYRASLTVLRALDAVPDPVSGVIVYRGRGGSAGRAQPRRPRPLVGSGAACLPVPITVDRFAIFEAPPPRVVSR